MNTDLLDALATLRAFHDQQASNGEVVTGRGLEALIAGATLGASRKTWILPGRRERGCALVRGATADRLDVARPYRVLPAGSSPAHRALFGVGMSLRGDPALVFLGTGSVSYGSFYEALSLAALRSAPVCFVVGWYQNPGPFTLGATPAALATGLGLKAVSVDGTDAEAVRDAVASGATVVQAVLQGRG